MTLSCLGPASFTPSVFGRGWGCMRMFVLLRQPPRLRIEHCAVQEVCVGCSFDQPRLRGRLATVTAHDGTNDMPPWRESAQIHPGLGGEPTAARVVPGSPVTGELAAGAVSGDSGDDRGYRCGLIGRRRCA